MPTPPRPTTAASERPKPVLPMTQLPIYRVKQRHLEAYLAKVYRMDGSTSCGVRGHPRNVPGIPGRPACRQPGRQQEADRIRRGHRSRNVALILNVLCLDGYIPAGTYTIDTHPEPPPARSTGRC